MVTFSLSLPESVHKFIEEQVAFGGYSSPSDYIQHLIEQDQKRVNKKQLESVLDDTLESEELPCMTDEWWQQKRAQVLEHLRTEDE